MEINCEIRLVDYMNILIKYVNNWTDSWKDLKILQKEFKVFI